MQIRLTAIALALTAVLIVACRPLTSTSNEGANVAASPSHSGLPAVTVVKVVKDDLDRKVRLSGELQPYQDVAIYARVPGFVEAIYVDRGSRVRRGQLLARLRAPELDAQRSEADARTRGAQSVKAEASARVQSARAQRLEAESKLAAEEATYRRLNAASATPGAVAGNDLEIARLAVESARARVLAWTENEKAAAEQFKALEQNELALVQAARTSKSIEEYLRITASFDGIITERNAHPGSLVGSTAGSPAMFRLQQIARLRLLVAVPETDVAGTTAGTRIEFTVPSRPGEAFSASVSRVSHTLDPKTRTMPVELDVNNTAGKLAPGMFPDIAWPTRRPQPSLFVPPTAIAVTTERTFVIRVRDGKAEWVDVKRGVAMNRGGTDLIEVFGDLTDGDQVAVRGTDELRNGTQVAARTAPVR